MTTTTDPAATDVAGFLSNEATYARTRIARLRDEIGDLEASLADRRQKALDLELRAVELEAASRVVHESGLRVDRVDGVVHAWTTWTAAADR